MNPPVPPLLTSTDIARLQRGLGAQLGALRQAAHQGRRLTADALDSVAGVASSLDAPAFHALGLRLAPLSSWDAMADSAGPAWRQLDSLRAEVLVWRVRAGP